MSNELMSDVPKSIFQFACYSCQNRGNKNLITLVTLSLQTQHCERYEKSSSVPGLFCQNYFKFVLTRHWAVVLIQKKKIS